MRRLVLMAIFCSGVLYAPLPLIAQNGGGQTPLIPVADMPSSNGGATAPSEPPLEVDPDAAPELLPPEEVGGGAEAPGKTAPPTVPTPEPAPEPQPAPTAQVAMPRSVPATPAQVPDEDAEGDQPVGQVPDEAPTAPEPEPDPDDDEQDEERFEEEFDGVPDPGQPNAPVVPEATAGPQLPRTGADVPAVLLSGLALTASGMSLRALCRGRS